MTAAGRLSLRARLLAGLLAVTAAGLVIMGMVSALVLRGHLLQRVDAQLRLAADRVAARWIGVPRAGVAQALLPSRFVVAVVDPATGVSRVVAGDEGDASRTAEALGRTGQARLAAVAASGRPFNLLGQPDLRAQAGYNRGGQLVVVAVSTADLSAAIRRLVVTELVTGAGLVALLALAGRWLITTALAPLSRMATTAHAIASGGDLSARMPVDGTEVGRLGAAINTMLDRIQQAFAARWRSEQKVRAFAADASHELRTPLTTIRGYAELYRQGAIPPEALPETMRRIEGEADRMGRLVSELLELARLDRASSLDLTDTDLAVVIRETVADAAAVAPDRPVSLDMPPQLPARVDEPRVRQVVANLLANVRQHTPPGTPARVRLAREGPGVLIEVADAGPGMSPEEAARAFDRFHRGSAARGSDGGSGLGLSIVQAIAAAHGGQASIESAPGEGTAVRVWLPDPPSASPSP